MTTASEQPFLIGDFLFTSTGVEIQGRPDYNGYLGAFEFAKRANRASGFWLADLMRYGSSRRDWAEKLGQVIDATGMSEKTAKNIRAVGAIEPSRRRDAAEFGHHEAVAGLPAEDQAPWLEKAIDNGWTVRELRQNIRSASRRKVIEGQAVLEGMYRVILADPPWLYGDRPPSGSGAQQHYPGMTIEEMCKLPVAAHALPNSVLFMWTTSPFLLLNPGPREVIEAWGFEYKTGMVWDKVKHGFGHYVEVRHEHLLICTRGSCLPDRPTPMFPSVLTERRSDEHSTKPASVRTMIERLYDGPYLELFAREKTPNWSCFGNDAKLWAQDAAQGAA